MSRWYFIPVLLLTCATSLAYGQDFIERYPDGWTTFCDYGDIHDMIDDGGYLWLATNGGLVRYTKADNTIELFTRENSCLPSSLVQSVLKDSSGAIVAFTRQGTVYFHNGNCERSMAPMRGSLISIEAGMTGDLWGRPTNQTSRTIYRYRDGTRASIDIPASDLHNDMTALAYGSDGIIWMTDGTTVVYYDSNADTVIPIPDFPLGFGIQAMTATPDNHLWGASANGVAEFADGAWTVHIDPQETGNAYDIEVRNGKVWVSTLNAYTMFDGNTWSYYRKDQIPGLEFGGRIIVVDDNDVLWTGVERVVKFDGATAVANVFSDTNLPSYASVFGTDNTGAVWLGTTTSLFRYDGSEMTRINVPATELHQPNWGVRALATDDRGRIWLNIGERVLAYDKGIWLSETELGIERVNERGITALEIDAAGNLWFGHQDGGLYRFDGISTTYFDPSESGLPTGWIMHLVAQTDGRMWASNVNGLAMFDPGSGTWIRQDVTWGADEGIADAGDGSVWLASANEIVRYDGDRVLDRLSSSNSPYAIGSLFDGAIAVDSSGSLWLGLRSESQPDVPRQGLYRFDGIGWDSVLSDECGVLGRFVGVGPDGSIWSSVDCGVATFNRSISGVEEPSGSVVAFDVAMSPNPAQDRLDVEFRLTNPVILTWSIADTRGATVVSGDPVYTGGGVFRNSIDISSVPPGTYFLRLDIEGRTHSRQFTVVR